MPKVKAEKPSNPKSTPYPTSKPASAGPSTLILPPISSEDLVAAQAQAARKAERKATKLERKKARKESLGVGSDQPQLPPEGQEAEKPARTESASTAISDATLSESIALPERKLKVKKDKKRKSKDISDGKVDSSAVEDGPAIPPYPQPGAVESTQDIVARLKAKTGKKHKSRLSQGSQADQVEGSKKAKKKFTMMTEGKVSILQKELDDAKEAAEKERAGWESDKVEMEKKVKEAEARVEEQAESSKVAMAEKEKDLAKSVKVLDTLREAATCGVCLDYFKDPHILACGHIACKTCLVSWFRTPVAFLHEVPDLLEGGVSINRDVSYRTKLCHVCRIPILRRPSRMYHFDSILEPLGINPQLPTLSQDAKEKDDPWKNLFPRERDTYRVIDEEDHITRCPECHGEIDEDYCNSCDIEFSESEGEAEDEENEVDEMDGAEIEDGEEVGLSAAERRAELAAEVRAEREIQAQENILASRANIFDMEARDSDSDSGEDEDGGEGGIRMRGSNGGTFGEDEEEEDDSDDEIVQMHRQEFRARDLDSDAEPTEDEDQYEDSFIDDDEDDENEEGSMNETREEEGDVVVSTEKKEDEDEEPSMSQMRERRLAKFDARMKREEPARSTSPVIRSSGITPRRRVIASSGSESD